MIASELFEEAENSVLHQNTELIEIQKIPKYFVEDPNVKLKNLIDPNSYLIEGNRGVGKSHYLRYAEYICDDYFPKGKILAVYISFNESLKIDSFKSQFGEYDPFSQWVSMKVLTAIFDKLREKRADIVQDHNDIFYSIFKIDRSSIEINKLMHEIIQNLEKTPGGQKKNIFHATLSLIKDRLKIGKKTVKETEILQNLEHIPLIKSTIKKIIEIAGINRVLLLYDEAAHTLAPKQQEKFFDFFKGLKDGKIAQKAAVYPLITNYGNQFDYLQDAKVININRSELNYESYYSFFDKILKKRLQDDADLYRSLSTKKSPYNLMMFSAFGNPRLFFDLIDEAVLLVENDRYNTSNIKKIIKTFVDEKLWKYYRNAARSEHYYSYMKLGEQLIKEMVISEILRKGASIEDKRDERVIYFAIKDEIYAQSYQIRTIFDYLEFGSIIAYRGKFDLSHKQHGRLYALNIAICISENLIDKEIHLQQLTYKGFRQINIKNHLIPILIRDKPIYLSYIKETKPSELREEDEQILEKKTKADKEELETIYVTLLKNSISKLEGYLTGFEYQLLYKSKKFKTIRDVKEATIKSLMTIPKIGRKRAAKIKDAVGEYLSG
ncbi:ORC-CDC6 family AAA ATPase [Candidatus Lokiarchaeum ossiferum]|uniref:ORC-CDC6 family AAA ATPase n=1 Tax=Candidatus Lokiarchaeum ossiferum TaxID=2951803 RepID=UPI00352C14D1